jgi:hypothetical protein
MAQQVQVLKVDDLDGSDADETLEFGLDGVQYEIDLSDDNATELRELLSEYIEHARKLAKEKRGPGRPAGTTTAAAARPAVDREQNQAIRAWATKNGYKVSERGRISQDVIDAYHAS